MKRPRPLGVVEFVLFLTGALSCAAAAIALAGTQDGARVALHVKEHTTKASTLCTTWSPNAEETPCSHYTTSGAMGQNYDVYLVVGHGDPITGVAGVNCRLQYDSNSGQGVDILGWTLCADQEVRGSGGHGEWPASLGTNSISWNAGDNCQRTQISAEGVHAVAGAFYVYAYSPDVLTISPGGASFAIKDCQGSTTTHYTESPSVVFSEYGFEFGNNPCERPCGGLPPGTVDWGAQVVGEVRDSTIMVRNPYSQALTGTWLVSGSAFALVSPTGPFSIGAYQQMPVTVRFAPTVTGTAWGYLSTGPSCWYFIPLTGTGINPCSFNSLSLDFGSLAISEAETLLAVLTNVAATPLLGTIQITGNDFELGSVSSQLALAPGDSMVVPVVFRPQWTGTRSGVLSAGSACPGVQLSGVGLVACEITPSGDFGTLLLGTLSETEFTLTNNRRTTIWGQPTLIGAPFSLTSGGDLFRLPPGDRYHFRVRFAPPSLGTFTGSVSLGTSCSPLTLTGSARTATIRCLTLPGSDLFLGFAQLGVGRTEIVRFANTGEGSFALTLSEESMSPNFSLPNGEGPFAVATGDTLDVPVRYDPLTTGVHVGTLVTNSPCANVRLVGFGQRSPVACIAAVSELDFGDVPVGASREMEFHLFNYSGELALGDVFVSCNDFSLTSDLFYQVSWADSELVRVRFAPRTLGAQSCAVAVTGSCGDTIEIAGYGIAPPDTARSRPWLFAASRPNEGVQRLVYDVLAAAHVEIIVFDVIGHELARFDEGVRVPGRFEVSWDARQRPGGIYFARIEAARASFTQRVLLLR